jgi:hypothetical protein
MGSYSGTGTRGGRDEETRKYGDTVRGNEGIFADGGYTNTKHPAVARDEACRTGFPACHELA